jgi:sacsin
VFPSSCSNEETIDCYKDGRCKHLTTEWVKQLWQFLTRINEELPKSLEKVEQLHILPINSTKSKVQLAKLSGPVVYLISKVHDKNLEKKVSSLLQYFGIKVLRALPDFVQHHPHVFDDDYVYQPHPESVMKAILKSSQVSENRVGEIVEAFNTKATENQKKAFRAFLQPVLKSASGSFMTLLKQLKMFETIGNYEGNGEPFAAAVDINIGVIGYGLSMKSSKDLLDLSFQDAQALAQCLGIRTMTETEILEEFIFDDIRNHIWPLSGVEKVMKLVLQNLDVHSVRSTTFITRLKELAFLMENTGNWLKPLDMFDPENGLLKKLFIGEDAFPGNAYSTCLVALRQLGLKTDDDVRGSDIIDSACFIQRNVNSASFSSEELEKKSKAIGAFLQKRQHLQTPEVLAKLSDIEWIPVQIMKPTSYPSTLPWEKPDTQFAKPSSVYSASHVNIIGLSLPTVKSGTIADEVIDLVHVNPIPLEGIVSHLSKVVKSYTASEKPTYMNMAICVYNALTKFDVKLVRNELQQLDCWLWHGDGFTSADCVVIDETSVENMHPYIYRLPDELFEFKDWLSCIGVKANLGLAAVLDKMQQWHMANRSEATKHRVRNDEALAVRIINKIAEQQEQGVLEDTLANILVPVTGGGGLSLLPAKDCTYCDSKMDDSEMSTLKESFQEDEERIHYLHPMISKATAESLGVKSLDYGRLFDNSGFDFASEIEECGQDESLTRRIRGLLEQNYRDGLVIPKELIQNADDAGATEIKFLFDERANEEYRAGLLDEGMEKYQGPALWVYNTATFTDEDLANIRKLSGATKLEKRDKIGQFGLGFNAVYNITDVPSFVTREFIVIFDPHRTHLSKVLKNNDPGLRINLCAGTSRMALLKKQFANQFKPYNGIFNCHINQESNQEPYDGTLFRLPLRPPEAKSELKYDEYSKSDVEKLLQVLVEQANNLLLFTQNVKKIGIYHLPPNCSDPTCPIRLFEAERNTLKIFKELPVSLSNDGASFGILKYADMLYKNEEPLPTEPIHSSAMIKTKSTLFSYRKRGKKQGKDCLVLNGNSSTQNWLLYSCIGKHTSFELGQKLNSCCPVAGVAVELQKIPIGKEKYKPIVYDNGAPLFCHMPLPSTIKSGLPLIINGSFALMSDRQHLQEQTSDDTSECTIYQWNAALMKDAIVEAYLGTLEQMTSFIDVNSCDPYCMWPIKEILNSSFQPFYESLFSEIAVGQGKCQEILYSGKGWIDFEHAVFLDKVIAESPLKKLAMTLVQEYLDSCDPGKGVVVLPEHIQQGFSNLKMKTFSVLQFYELAFFPRIGEVQNPGRDKLIKFALLRCKEHNELNQLIQSTPCIAVEGTSVKFLKPCELIFPNGKCGKLYDVEDERFPIDKLCKGKYSDVLKGLGMAVDEIPWEEVLHRAEAIQRLQEQKRWSRTSALLSYIERKLEICEPSLQIKTQLKHTKFLPILPKPPSCPLSWKGSDVEYDAVQSATELYACNHHTLVGNRYLILDEKRCGLQGNNQRKKVIFKLLGLNEKKPSLQNVIETLDEFTTDEIGNRNKQDVENYCKNIYSYLDIYCSRGLMQKSQVADHLRGKRCILVQNHFMEARCIAKDFTKMLPPYLCYVPHMITYGLKNLLQALEIREEFTPDDYINALHRIKADSLTDVGIYLVRDIAESLQNCRDRQPCIELGKSPTTSPKPILLPSDTQTQERLNKSNQRKVKLQLLPVDDLCLRENSKSWLRSSDQNLIYVHRYIPHRLACDLGVKSDCESIISSLGIELGQPFGQKEKLTTRIKGILQGYPCDSGILRELLQNADDAGATELKFILDDKGQRGDRILSTAWKELQGPALCVYNNKPFTEEDLKGICSLGLGSKNTDPTKTGLYGIGFNSVYHLTDAPSFLTEGEEIGRTVGILDPNCRFVPGATSEYPGRYFQKELLEKVAGVFPGSFSGYLEDEFPSNGATMFRLPLRTKKAAEKSEISNKPVAFEDIETFFGNLQAEVFQCLLFVNSVRNISFVNTRNAKQDYWVKVTISKDDEALLANFTKHMKNVSARLKSGDMDLKDVAYEEVVYTLHFDDSKKRKEVWSVCQSIGFKDSNIPEEVQAAYKSGDISLLPRGGAALCKSKRPNKHLMFCFLPLPQPGDTHLPFHINGHFALDANRRGLWGPNHGCYRTAWNRLVIEECIAKACNSLMNVESSHLKEKKCPLAADLKKLYSLYPDVPLTKEEGYENMLASAFYREMASSESEYLAAIAMTKSEFKCRWFTVQDCIAGKVAFDNPAKEPKMKKLKRRHRGKFPHRAEELKVSNILSRLGYNLLEAVPQFIFTALRSIDKNVLQVTDKHVLKFLQQYDEHPECTLRNLPQHISESPFINTFNLVKIVKYCLLNDYSMSLCGLPLCLTSDQMLRVFDAARPVFTPMFSSLIPERPDLFMNRQSYFSLPPQVCSHVPSPVTELTIGKFSSLAKAMPEYQHFLQERTEWSPDEDKGKRIQKWLQDLWILIGQEIRQNMPPLNLSLIAIQLSPLLDFCILPAHTEPDDKHILYRISNAKQVVHPFNLSRNFKDILPLLKTLGVPMLQLEFCGEQTTILASTYTPIATKLVSHQEDGVGTLNALWQLHKQGHFQLTSNQQAELLLKYFSNYVHEYDYERHLGCITLSQIPKLPSAQLLDLPIHITVDGNIVSLEGCTVVLIPPFIPKAGLDNCFSDRTGKTERFIFKEYSDLVSMYEGCGCCNKKEVEIYTQLLLLEINFCKVLNENERLEHLEFITRYILPDLSPGTSKYEALISSLQCLPFVTDTEGQLHRAEELYNPMVRLYAKMEKDFPSEIFTSNDSLLDLLLKCCLKTTVTPNQLLKYAEVVEEEAQSEPTAETVKKAKLIFEELEMMADSLTEEQLFRMKIIRFLPIEKCGSKHTNFHPQHLLPLDIACAFTCFQDSVVYNDCDKCWTVAPILPHWIEVSQEMKWTLTKLGVQHPLPIKTAVSHCIKLSRYLASQNMAQKSPEDMMKFMTILYEYFQEHEVSLDANDYKELANAPCICVDAGDSMIQPRQVVLGLNDDCEMKPYLYKLPLNLCQYYAKLLCRIGVREQLDYKHYMDILKVIHEDCQKGDPALDCNQERSVKIAITNFMMRILKEDKPSIEPSEFLYLLSRRKTLELSTEMAAVDDPRLLPEDVTGVHWHVIDDSLNLNVHELHMLPECLRPKLLSTIIEEVLDESIGNSAIQAADCGDLFHFRNHLQSVSFLEGLKRLLSHDAMKRGEKVDVFNDSWASLHQTLMNVIFFTVPKIVTVLRSCTGNEIIANSKQESSKVFMTRAKGCKVYIQQNEERIMLAKVQQEIAKYISIVTRIQTETALVLPQILSCSPNQISEVLDENHVSQYGESTGSDGPVLGGFIPLVQHCLLQPDFVKFLVGEIVGLERDDPLNDGKDGEATYLYAKIICCIRPSEEEEEMGLKYEIDLGDSRIIVPATDLYKFTRNRSESTPDKPVNLAEAKRMVTADLTYAFNYLNENEQKKFLKRMIMKWQKESNTDLSSAILKFIEKEVQCIPRENKGSTSQGSYHNHHWLNSSCIFQYARERANVHRDHIKQFQQQESGSSSNPLDFSYLRYRGKNPQPGEARRWYRQAKCDLLASRDDDCGSEKAYEWALQKCHQVSRIRLHDLEK